MKHDPSLCPICGRGPRNISNKKAALVYFLMSTPLIAALLVVVLR